MTLVMGVLVLVWMGVTPAFATTYTATTCSYADVSAKADSSINTALVDGDTVIIPACSQTNWSTQLNITKGITLQGQGMDATIIGDNVCGVPGGGGCTGSTSICGPGWTPGVPCKDGGGTSSLMSISTNANFRITGIGFVGVVKDAGGYNKGHIVFSGSVSAARIDHNRITDPQTTFLRAYGCLYGVMDHNIGTAVDFAPFANVQHDTCFGSTNYGDGSWANALEKGSANAIYIEDNTWNAATSTFAITQFVDGYSGLRMVVRFNNLVNSNLTMHGTDSGHRVRSSRWRETYHNTFSTTNASNYAYDFLEWFRGGSGVMFNNTYAGISTVNNVAKRLFCRDGGDACGEGFSFTPWGFCTGASGYDQNSPGQNGYRCVDQTGAGTSNNLASVTTPTAAWVGNILEPVYVFNNGTGTTGNCGGAGCGNTGNVQTNRDVYFQNGAFAGSAGVGVGTLASRPSTCTAGVGYWVTDEGSWNTLVAANTSGRFYTCTATNTWTLTYTPYTYPHPLQGGGSTASASITSPVGGSNQTVSTTFTVSGTATAGNGSLTRVDVYIDGTLTCSDTVASFSPWTCNATAPASVGTYTLTAKATDADGQGPSSSGVTFNAVSSGGGGTPSPKFSPAQNLRIGQAGERAGEIVTVSR